MQEYTNDAIGYLKTLFLPGDTLDVLLIHQKTKVVHDNFSTLEDAATQETIESIGKAQQDGWNVYVVMNALQPAAQHRKKQDVQAIRAVYIDVDANGQSVVNSVLEDVEAGIVPDPSFVLKSSPGKCYIVWLVQGFQVEQAEAMNCALQQRYHADPAATDVSRVLRLPGTRNLKYPDQPVVEIVDRTVHERYTPDEFHLPEVLKTPVSTEIAEIADDAPVSEGSRNSWLASMAGKARQNLEMTQEMLENYLIALNDLRCRPPLTKSEVLQTARSIARYPIKDTTVLVGGVPAGTAQPAAIAAPVSTLITKEQLLARIASEEAIKANQLDAEMNKPWPDVIPLKPELLPVLPFQTDFLPISIRPWVVDVAQRMSVPLDFTGVCAICTISGVIGRRAFVYPKALDKDWKESLCLSGAVVASSAKKKTPVWAFFTDILQKIDMHRREEYTKIKAFYETSVKNWEDVEAKRHAKTGQGVPAEFPKPQEPEKARRCIANDSTPEALHGILSLNPEGLLYFRDELSGWIEESVKSGREAQLKFFLMCMNGDGIYVMDRITRGEVAAVVCANVFGGFQPKLLMDFLQGDGGRHIASGLVPRFFLMVWPDEIPAVWTDAEPNEQAKQLFEEIAKKLARMTEKTVSLHFTPEAQLLFKQWDGENTRKIDEEQNEGIRSHFGKYPGQLARLAALFQLVDAASAPGPVQGSHQIDLQHLEQAIRMTAYLESHARRIYSCIRTPVQLAERSLAEHVQAGDLPDMFKLRDVAQKDWAGLTDRDYCEYACDLLEDKGWIRKIEPPQGSKGGRPTVRYQINPAIKAGWARPASRDREAA